MSLNLLQTAKSKFTDDVVSVIAEHLGESKAQIATGVQVVVPAIIWGFIAKSGTLTGAKNIILLSTEHDLHIDLKHVKQLLGNKNQAFVAQSLYIKSILFGDNAEGVTKTISRFSGIQSATIDSLMTVAILVLLDIIRSEILDNEMQPFDVAAFLKKQQVFIAADDAAVFDFEAMMDHGNNKPAGNQEFIPKKLAEDEVFESSTRNARTFQLILPAIVILILGFAGLFFSTGGCSAKINLPKKQTAKHELIQIYALGAYSVLQVSK